MLCVIEYFAKSLKIIRNDTVEYAISIPLKLSVSCSVSEIFSVKEWRDLETGVVIKVIENSAAR